jgi:hypothetical protein
VVEFDAHNYTVPDVEVDIPTMSSMMTKHRSMNYSTSTNSQNVLKADEIAFKNTDSANAYFMESIGISSPDDDDLTIQLSNMSSDGLLQLQGEEEIQFQGDLVVKYKDTVLANNVVTVSLDSFCTFYISAQSDIEIYMDKDRSGLALSGTTDKISGKLHGDANLYSISKASQNEFYCGNQKIDISGEDLSLEYVYGLPEQDMVISGRAKKATLESVDVLEGLIQFIFSNYANIIMTIAAALFGVLFTNLSSNKKD